MASDNINQDSWRSLDKLPTEKILYLHDCGKFNNMPEFLDWYDVTADKRGRFHLPSDWELEHPKKEIEIGEYFVVEVSQPFVIQLRRPNAMETLWLRKKKFI